MYILKVLLVSILSLFAIGVLAILALRLAYPQPTAPDTKTITIIPATPTAVLEAVNKERSKVGVAPLKLHLNIAKSAQLKADDMWYHDYRTHEIPYITAQKVTLTDEMADLVNPVCSSSSENLTYYKTKSEVMTAEQAIIGWLSSPAHKKAMLDPKYTYTGIGVSHNNLVVQRFCVAK